jgi:hypothetical protein
MTASDRQTVTELQAQSATNLFLSDHLPDRFTADQPVLNSTRDTWHVPVILEDPVIGSIGQVGEVLISNQVEKILFHTPWKEMKSVARSLYDTNRDAIEEALDECTDGKVAILEDFRQAWHEAMTGQTIPVSQLWDELKNL